MPEGLRCSLCNSSRNNFLLSCISLFTFMHCRRQWQPTPVFLLGKSQGWGSRVGCRLWGHTEFGHDWSDLAAAAAVEIKCMINIMCLNHPETIPHAWSMEKLSSWNSPLVSKRLGTTALDRPYSFLLHPPDTIFSPTHSFRHWLLELVGTMESIHLIRKKIMYVKVKTN